MEYGDLSSLAVEYPDYNSMGNVLMKLPNEVNPKAYTMNEAYKVEERMKLPKNMTSLSELGGRALIVTTKDGDLVAYGILKNE